MNFPLTNQAFAAIVTPIDANYYIIIGATSGAAMVRSSDGTLQNSYTMPPGGWYSMIAPNRLQAQARYVAGSTVCYLMSTQPTDNAVVEFSL